ncbi:MAG: hypothetical protein COA78_19460 [Blastopirellula sp.]|nr:MAG: hypothetical protein COA78_19460 [Blastopirellula sp.]
MRYRFLHCFLMLSFLSSLGMTIGVAQAAESKAENKHEAGFQKQITPFLKTYCIECHQGEDAEADLDLTKYDSASKIMTSGRKQGFSILDMLTTGDMPPGKSKQPQGEEVQQTLDWLKAALSDYDCSSTIDPGRETIRRLNRVEYENTIRDLMGVRFKATEEFPADDVGYGFDNIGAVLSLSPLLMEKYYQAAVKIADEAIIENVSDIIPTQNLRLDKFRSKRGTSGSRNSFSMATTDEAIGEFEVTQGGEYIVTVMAYGSRAGNELPKMKVTAADRKEKIFNVSATRGNPKAFEYPVRLKQGKYPVSFAFLNDHYDPENKDPNKRDRNLYVTGVKIVGPLQVSSEDYPESHRRIFVTEPGKNGISEGAAFKQIISRFTSRAFRRSVTDNELNRLLLLAKLSRDSGSTFEQAIKDVVIGVLCSPNFLFKVEIDEEPGMIRKLNQYELATRMSYFLWSSMPDDELFGHAWRGTLIENLDFQIARMLKDDKRTALIDNFAGQWLQLRSLDSMTPDKKQFRSFNSELAEAMQQETKLFVASVFDEDRSILELIDADYTFVNEPLAKHYGISGIQGDKFQRVKLKDDRRGGILTHASLLTVTSNPTRTSPVKRGKWIMENILGTPPPEPPADVPTLEAQEKLTGSLRERMKQHRENPACASCHARMDPIGFALENYDAVGAWRDKDGEHTIDASGELPGGIKFEGAKGLKQLVLGDRRDDYVRTLSEKMLTYALGRGLEYFDTCAVDQITAKLEQEDYKFSVLIREIVHSEPFTKRRENRSE